MQVEQSTAARGCRVWFTTTAIAIFLGCGLTLAAMPAAAQTLERVGETGRIKLGYLADARPFTYRSDSAIEGYAVTLCQRIAEEVKVQLAQPDLSVEWVPVTPDSRVREVQRGNIDLLCAPLSVTLSRREEVAFSLPIFAGGNRAVVRADARKVLRDVLSGADTGPVWRGSPASKVLQGTSFAVVSGTTSEDWLAARGADLQVDARVVPVPDYRTGLRGVLDREVDVFFGERTIILGVMEESERRELMVVDHLFTHEQIAFVLQRGDERFRLLVDRVLSETYASSEFPTLYSQWFGEFSEDARTFFQWNTLAE